MKYIIIDSERLETLDLSEVPHHTKETIRRSLNGFKCVLKFDVKPSFIDSDMTIYTKEQILDITLGSEWTSEIEL
ncbi:hypothetical protein [uncultured Mediterranean phage uvMED]|nr:hypothetical protein [uncultured Mediterranean phage uvMED]